MSESGPICKNGHIGTRAMDGTCFACAQGAPTGMSWYTCGNCSPLRAELTELRAVLAAADIHKEKDGTWSQPCSAMGCKRDAHRRPLPIPNLAPVAGGSHD